MILDPDFLDHWKTRLFIDLMEDEMASNYILRLWFHCQLRRTTTFDGMTGQVLKAVCRYQGDGNKLRETMLRVGFIEVDGDTVSVPKWAETNDKMAANWANGHKGGRPKKPAKTPEKTPSGNPTETQPEPNDNPRITGRKVGREEGKEGKNAPCGELEKIAAEMATEFQFGIPGRSVPMLDELRENFLAKLQWLKANGRNETEAIWRAIRDPARDKTQVMTVNQMFKFWKLCGLEGDQRDAAGTNPGQTNSSTARRSVPGGDGSGKDASRYDGSRVKVLRRPDPAAVASSEPVVPPSQPAAASSGAGEGGEHQRGLDSLLLGRPRSLPQRGLGASLRRPVDGEDGDGGEDSPALPRGGQGSSVHARDRPAQRPAARLQQQRPGVPGTGETVPALAPAGDRRDRPAGSG